MESVALLDCAGRRHSPATLANIHQGRAPRKKGLRYPPDPPTVEEIVADMRAAGSDPDGLRLRGVIVVLWRAGVGISEALALTESDLDGLAARCWFAGGRSVGDARSAWTAGPGSTSTPWLQIGSRLPVGALPFTNGPPR
jgi:integrase